MSSKRHWRKYPKPTPLEEMLDFLDQSNISKRNLEKVRLYARSECPETRKLAQLVLEIARVKPHRRRRMRFIAERHWPIFLLWVETLGAEVLEASAFEIGGDMAVRLLEHIAEAQRQLWMTHSGSLPCRCGSGATYAECCADHDDREYQSLFPAAAYEPAGVAPYSEYRGRPQYPLADLGF